MFMPVSPVAGSFSPAPPEPANLEQLEPKSTVGHGQILVGPLTWSPSVHVRWEQTHGTCVPGAMTYVPLTGRCISCFGAMLGYAG